MEADEGRSAASGAAGVQEALRRWVERPAVQNTITVLILINAVTLGLETWPLARKVAGDTLWLIDRAILTVFVIEILTKLAAYRLGFWKNGWNVFDFLVVGIALVPATQALSVLRALRVLRVLRLVSVVPQMRLVVQALLSAIPGLASIIALMAIIYYVNAVIATRLFGASFPDWFGTLGASTYSLFQIMTLESWSMGIVRPVMEVYPYAWAFFVPFILVTSFAVLNLFIALIINSMQAIHDQEARNVTDAKDEAMEAVHAEKEALAAKLDAVQAELAALRESLEK